MKGTYIKFLTMIIIFSVFVLPVRGHHNDDVFINGIYYSLNQERKTAEVSEISIHEAIIPSSVEDDGLTYNVISISNAMLSNSYTESITLPNSITRIGDYTFSGWTKLIEINIPNSVTSIGRDAFARTPWYDSQNTGIIYAGNVAYGYKGDMPKNTDIVLRNGTVGIADYAFNHDVNLRSVTFPRSLRHIGECSFSGCSGLTSVVIPEGVTYIGVDAFLACSDWTGAGLSSVTLPSSLKNLGMSAFQDCPLASVELPNGLTTIPYSLFCVCKKLSSVTIPESITNIEDRAFDGCNKLQDIYCFAIVPPTAQITAFEESYDFDFENTTLHVPYDAIEAYQAAEPWNKFGSIEWLPGTRKCATPTITYENGELRFSCTTEDVEFFSTITDADITSHIGSMVQLEVTYNISVYAKKTDYENSDVATAMLCWIESEPKTDGTSTEVTEVKARAILIRSNNGVLTITSEEETEAILVQVYNTAGQQVGAATMSSGTATINTNLQHGDIAIVKIGEKSVKVMMK